MKDLVYKKKDVLGIDVGTTEIKYVQLKKINNLAKLVGYGHFKIPENFIIEGIITEPEKLAKITKKMLEDPPWGKITAERAIASLPDSKIFTHVLELPSMKEKEIEDAVMLEIDQSIPSSLSDLYTDWEIIKQTKEKVFVFMAASPRVIVDSYVHFLRLISMEPLALEFSLAATTRAIIKKGDEGEAVLILDIGGQSTNMAIYDNGIQIAGSYPAGSEAIIKTPEQINQKELKTNFKNEINSKRLPEITKGSFEKIFIEIDRMVKYFEDRKENKKISKIILCGGIGAMPELDLFIEKETGLKTIVGNPWSNISIYPLKPVQKKDIPMFSTAIGLSMRGLLDE